MTGERRASLILLLALVLLVRCSFLYQAVQGDDVYYLASAEHAQFDPLHPNHTHYIFEGREVDFRGYPHPPFNAWCLAGLIAIFGGVRELPFHAAYLLFSLLAVTAMYALAVRFATRPLWAALLFLAAPAFLVNGNSFESDVPFVAFWLAGAACFVHRRWAAAFVFLFLSGLTAFQSVLFTPILLVFTWLFARREKAAWVVPLAPVLAIAGFQLFELVTSGQLPAQIATGYLVSYGYERWAMKLRNLAALGIHASWIVCPPLLFWALWRARRDRRPETWFLLAWIAIFFLGAAAIFYSGSMRYLLPMAAPVAILCASLPKRWVAAGFAVEFAASLALATVNYQHWDGYRQFAGDVMKAAGKRRVWVDAEWGLRHYLEARGAVPLRRDQWVPPGDIVVASELAYPAPYSRGLSTPVTIAARVIDPALPVRLIGLAARSGYSTVDKGFLPFDARGGAIDRVHADLLELREPRASWLAMDAREADEQILSGIYAAEGAPWRWMTERGVIVFRAPLAAGRFRVKFYVPGQARARHLTVKLDDRIAINQAIPGEGSFEFTSQPFTFGKRYVTAAIEADRTFQAPGDARKLAIILNGAGFVVP